MEGEKPPSRNPSLYSVYSALLYVRFRTQQTEIMRKDQSIPREYRTLARRRWEVDGREQYAAETQLVSGQKSEGLTEKVSHSSNQTMEVLLRDRRPKPFLKHKANGVRIPASRGAAPRAKRIK